MKNRYFVLICLYLAQGLPYGFFTQALPTILREKGYSLTVVGLSSLLALPWALKFIWAPLVDKFGSVRWGRRKSFIIPLQLVSVLSLIFIAYHSPSQKLDWLWGFVLLMNFLAATQDIATDALAIDILSPKERGFAGGLQVAGYRVGMIIGGGAILIFYTSLGWKDSFWAMAAILALMSLPILFFKEKKAVLSPETKKNGFAKLPFWKRKTYLAVLVFAAWYKFGDAFAQGMLRPYLVDRGFSLSEIGWLLGTIGFGAGLAGALGGGFSLKYLSKRKALTSFALATAFSVAGYALIALFALPTSVLVTFVALEHFTGGLATATLFAAMMDSCRAESAATDYSLLACVVVISSGVAQSISGLSAEAWGYGWHFSLAAVMAASAGLLLSVFRNAFEGEYR